MARYTGPNNKQARRVNFFSYFFLSLFFFFHTFTDEATLLKYAQLKRMEKEEEAKKELAQEIEDIDENIESYEEVEEVIQPEEMMDINSFKESLDYSENEFYDVKDFVRQNWEGRMNDL